MTERRERVTVRFGDLEWNEYEDVTIERSVLAAAGGFELTSSPRRPAPAGPSDAITIAVDDQALLVGHVEALEHSINKEAHELKLGGRDLTGDVVDSSVNPAAPLEFTNSSLISVVLTLLAPFPEIMRKTEFRVGGRITDNFGAAQLFKRELEELGRSTFGTIIPRFPLEPQESVWSAIDRLARLRAATVYGKSSGGLIFSAPDESGALEHERAAEALVYGRNLKTARLELRDADRFSTYTVRGQRPGSDAEFGLVVSEVEGRATDPAVRRNRPLLILADSAISPESAAQLAAVEASVRAGQSRRLIVTVPGWTQSPLGKSGGKPWDVNLLVAVDVPPMSLADDLLVEKLIHRRSKDAGTSTELWLVRPDAFLPRPAVLEDDDPFTKYLGAVRSSARVRPATAAEER